VQRHASLLLLALALYAGSPGATPNAEREAEAAAKLEALRADIRKITADHAAVSSQRDEGLSALRSIDTEISATSRRLRAVNAAIELQNAALAAREAERVALNATLGRSRETLARLLRSVYAIGRGESLKALLARDRISDSSRALAYYRYLQRDRMQKVRKLLADLAAVAEIERVIHEAKAKLVVEQSHASRESARLGDERQKRERVLATFDEQLALGQTRLEALGRDEQDLLRLLEELRDIFADIPKQIEAALPFASMRGRLRRPHAARISVGYGDPIGTGRVSEGWLLAADVGDEVHAVAHGRVAFADWLKGFGLLLILDHGDGYLTLYAQNEALLKDVGDWVEAGAAIATSGASGGAAQAGLYFELRHQGRPLDPKPWFAR